MKYIDYPVGPFTGVPDINIPLYTINESDLTVPISLSYHASGMRPGAPNGIVGMGWTLNTGGKISRTIMGAPDEIGRPNPFYSLNDLAGQSYDTRNTNISVWSRTKDTEPDIFTYSFNNHNGKFVLKDDGITPLLLPYKPIKFSVTGGVSAVDESGIVYDFAPTERTIPPAFPAEVGWDLARMTSPTIPGNFISFIAAGYGERTSDYTEIVAIDDVNDQNGLYRSCWTNDFGEYPKPYSDVLDNWWPNVGSNTPVDYASSSPQEIDFRSGRVVFTAENGTGRIQKMEIKDKRDSLVRSVEFVYEARPTNRQLLKEIKFFDSQHKFINHYLFEYNNEASGAVNTSDQCSTDYWGYYNGDRAGQAAGYLLPAWTVARNQMNTYTVGTNARQTNLNCMKTFVLNKIVFPTGGFSTYDYEANTTITPISNYSGNDVGGLRVKTITHYATTASVPEVHTYEYPFGWMDFAPGNINDYSYSMLGLIPDYGSMGTGSGSSNPMTVFRRRYISSEPLFNICPHGSPVVYPTVTEYVGDGTQNIGKTIYWYDYQSTKGQTTYESNGSTDAGGNPIIYKQYLKPYQDWTSGNLVSKSTFKNVNGTYYPVTDESYGYTDSLGESVRGFKYDRFIALQSDHCTSPPSNWSFPDDYDPHFVNFVLSAYNYGDYSIQSGKRLLASKSVSQYDLNGQNPVTTTTGYTYGNIIHHQPTQKKVNLSTGDSIITQYKYPHDFVSQFPYDGMVNTYHIWSPVIEQLDYKNTVDAAHFLTATKTDYSVWNGNSGQIYPLVVSTKKGAGTYDPRVQYFGYDSQGNVQSVSKNLGSKIIYIWSYGGTYPVAQITNADYATVVAVLGQASITGYLNNTAPTDANLNSFLAPLRSAPALAGAQVTTYTYQPLVGMTSATDPRGNKTYYEYDNFQRLSNIKDQFGNIKTHYCYNYAGQPTDCTIPPAGPIVYAKMTVSNTTTGQVNGYTHTYKNYLIHLYSNPQCTLSYTAASDMQISYRVLTTVNNTGAVYSDYSPYITIPQGSSSANTDPIDVSGCYPGSGTLSQKSGGATSNAATGTGSADNQKSASPAVVAQPNTQPTDPNAICVTSTVTLQPGTGYNAVQ